MIRYKNVCKSWKSLISHPRFGKAHHNFRQVNHNSIPKGTTIPDYFLKYGPEHYMVGSSNGLACINSFDGDEIIVANPWTRVERKFQKLPVSQVGSCWGFGYDALTDDYKVVFGAKEGRKKTSFHVLSLKSDVWKHVGHAKGSSFCVVQLGTLSDGALRWVVEFGKPSSEGLICFDLSKDLLKEIHQPELLEIKEEYVCVSNKRITKLSWGDPCPDFSRLWMQFQEPYAFMPTTVMPSLISPYLQEGNE